MNRDDHGISVEEVVRGLVVGVGSVVIVVGMGVFGDDVGVFGSVVGGIGVVGVGGLVARVSLSYIRGRSTPSIRSGQGRVLGDRAGLWWRPSVGGRAVRRLLRACGTVDGLVDYLLLRAVRQLPESFRDRFGEEWLDHRTHLRGLRLIWWALCVRITASRTSHELQHPDARLPRAEG